MLRVDARVLNPAYRYSGFGAIGPWLAVLAVGVLSLVVISVIINMIKLGYAALCRAAFEVAEKAKKENRKLPMWKNGKVIYDFPAITPQQVAAANADKPRSLA